MDVKSIPYGYIRALELEGRHPKDAGIWTLTLNRLIAGEGIPGLNSSWSNVNFLRGQAFPQAPALPSGVPMQPRHHHYSRLRSSEECRRHLETPGKQAASASLYVYRSWLSATDGVIPMPLPSERPLAETHNVALRGYDDSDSSLVFENNWGEEWGKEGFGKLSCDYFDRNVFECYSVSRIGPNLRNFIEKQIRLVDGVNIVGVGQCRWQGLRILNS